MTPPAEGPPVETELKLELTAEAMEQLLSSPLVRERAEGEPRTQELRSVYYDTGDRRLRAASSVLRVREVDGRCVQTLKAPAAGGAGGLAKRHEWEVELAGPAPRPDAFPDPAAHDAAGLLLADELEPVFETRFRRRSLLLRWPGGNGEAARIELAVDEGRVSAKGGGEAPLREIELELKEGDAPALFGLAEAMRALVPLRIQPLDKAARGWMLATGEGAEARKAKPLALDDDLGVSDALGVILAAGLHHWLENEPAAGDGRDPEGVHQLRVALRRLRSTLSLFADVLPADALDRWDGDLRWLLGGLGPARDLDVLGEDLLAPLPDGLAEDPGIVAFRRAADAARGRAQEGVREVLRSQRYADLALSFAGWVAREGWREGADEERAARLDGPVRRFAAEVLERRHGKALKRGKGFAGLDPHARHRVRIALKKLRYGAEFFHALFPAKRVQRFKDAAADLQDRLGHLNDVAVAGRLAHELTDPLKGAAGKAAAFGGGQLVGWHARTAALLEPEAVAAWKAFRKLHPFWRGA